MILIIVLTITAVIVTYFLTSCFNYWKNKNVPYPPVSYIFGNIGPAILLKKAIHEVYDELYKKYPQCSYIGIYRIITPCVLLRDLNLIKEVMVKSFNNFLDNDIYMDEKQDPLFAKNPFVSKGQLWKENRSQLSSSFTTKKVKEMYPLIDTVATNLVKYIDTKIVGSTDGVEAKDLFVKYTTDVVTSCALGLDANSFADENSKYTEMIKTVFGISFIGKVKLFLMFNLPKLTKLLKMKFFPDEADKYYRSIINDAIDYRIKNNIQRGDFLESMNNLKQKTEFNRFTDDDIAGHVASFIAEGTETSAIVLSFTIYELALNPDIQDRLRAEIDATTIKYQGQMSFDAINEIEYLEQVINETMRKNTVAPLIRRVCTEQFTFKSPDGNGPDVTIESGTPIIIPVHSIHNDPQYYQNPSVYDPSRFSSENKGNVLNYTFMPFGEGPRVCLGMRFGYTQVKTALVQILANFEITLHKKTVVPYKIDPQYFLLAAKGGLWFTFNKRRSNK